MSHPIIILGGGLWGGLLAYKLHTERPEIDFILYEMGSSFGGNHTWSFHQSDVAENIDWLKPFIVKSWNSYQVIFPKYKRELNLQYHSISSERFHEVMVQALPSERYRLNAELEIEHALKQGSLVIDARGLTDSGEAGYQKFLGLELELKHPHHLAGPILMDASVEQIDGFRFVYSLPWSEQRILVEDTRYSLSNELNPSELEDHVLKYAKASGWEVKTILRREIGVLPIPLSLGKLEDRERVINFTNLFHDTTGYSLPFAVKTMQKIISLPEIDFKNLKTAVSDVRFEVDHNRKFFRTLNKLLFKSAKSEERYRMLEFFYQHKQPLIERFYAGNLTHFDKFKFFLGKPPVSIMSAAKTFIQEGLK